MKLGAKDVILALLSGLLMAAAAPIVVGTLSEEPLIRTPLVEVVAWFGLIPLLFAIDGLRARSAFWAGLLAGLAHFGVVLYWITVALTVFGGIPAWGAVPILGLLVAYCALYWGAFAAICAYVKTALGTPYTVAAPVSFVALELLRNHLLSGFPWGNIGYTQYRNLGIVQVSSIAGVYAVTFLLVFSSALFHEWQAFFLRRRPSRPVASTVVFAALVTGAFVYGAARAGTIAEQAKAAPAIEVAVLQGNVDQGIKNVSGQFMGSIAGIYNRLAREAGREGADLVVWPEAAYPVTLPRDVRSFNADWSLLEPRDPPAHALVGASTWYLEDGHRMLHNSAFVLDPALRVLGRYDKAHLVPFGEYVPLGLPVEKIVSAVGFFSPGSGEPPAPFERNGATVRLGPLICYEGIFPEISRRLAGAGANLLVNLTNDAWYGVTSAPYQHLSMYVFRAIENGRYLARAANTGVSGFIDPYGRVLSRSRIFAEDRLAMRLPLIDAPTIYTRVGDAFAIACTVAAALVLLAAFSVSRRRPTHD